MFRPHNLRKGRRSLSNHFYAITICTKNKTPHFTYFEINRSLILTLKETEATMNLEVIAFTLMPEHIHFIVKLNAGSKLSQVIRYFKGKSSAALRGRLTSKLWQQGYYEHCIRSENELLMQARYIAANPLRKKLCSSLSEYPYWDCIFIGKDRNSNDQYSIML